MQRRIRGRLMALAVLSALAVRRAQRVVERLLHVILG
jgi:hypothetical protein